MTEDPLFLLGFIAVCALATFATRVLPFIAFSRQAEHPLVLHLGRYLPPAVMLILVTYAMRDWRPLSNGAVNLGANGLAMLLAALIVALLQLWRHNALLSIVTGTVSYMAMIQLFD
ncbi:branched-chain amino acid transporter permease [Onishia niordana]|uniref:branched-chain amino acid transporter permease n=1 Tax=Onishia niordana TaxID=2508711 RepID=UPI00109EF521|nr:AzlD domain-containing protein [Halomonas niordiana]